MALISKKGQKRIPASRDFLQSAIVDAVKKSDPDCEPFIGVILQQTHQAGSDSNWIVRGVKFGRANRDKANEVLKAVVEKMQSEFLLSDEKSQSHRTAGSSK